MNEDLYLECSRCEETAIRSPLARDGMCEKCVRAVHIEIFRKELQKLPEEVGRRGTICALNVEIADYQGMIDEEHYTLVKIDDEIREVVGRLLEIVNLDTRQDVIDQATYLYALGVPLDRNRVESHLHNRFAPMTSGYSKAIMMGLDTGRCDWSFRHKSIHRLSITKDVFDEMSQFQSNHLDPIDPNVPDLQFILNRLRDREGGHLFRGINNFYYADDGIAASIYRNNPEIARQGRLQDHECEIVDRLLGKEFYNPEGKSAVSALTDLRHSGMDTCILDFSEDPNIALFFSCQRRPDDTATTAEILILRKDGYEECADVSYPNTVDFLVHPTRTDITRNRVEAQSSVFLYCHEGFASRSRNAHRIENLLIAPSLKPPLYELCAHTDETVYPDFQSFIANPANFVTTVKQGCQQSDEADVR